MSTNDTKESVTMDDQKEDFIAGNEQLSGDPGDAAADQDEAAQSIGEQDAKLAALERLAEENQNRYLRAQADFDNFRRRTMKEKEELAQYATAKLVGQLLPVLDNFQRALQTNGEAAEQSDSFAKGVDMIYRQLFQVLESEGLKPMQPVGQPFDPEHHQAIMQVETDEYEEGTVVEVMQSGYWLKDKVIRPAMVKVSG